MKNRKTVISASLLGQVERCPYCAYLDQKGYAGNSESRNAARRGNEYHKNMNSKMEDYRPVSFNRIVATVLALVIVALMYIASRYL